MPKHSEDKIWAKNYAKFMSKKAKSDTERRRWFNIFLNLSDLIKIEIKDDPNPTNPVKASAVELPSIDDEAAKMLKRIKNGGDDGIPDSKPSIG